jgi:hypothetical protein
VTGPFNFGSMQPAPLVRGPEPQRGGLGEFAQFLMALQSAQEDRAAKRERLDMDRRAFDENVEMNKQTRILKQRELDASDAQLAADEFVDSYVRRALTDPGLDETKLSAIQGEMIAAADKKQRPYVIKAFNTQFADGFKGIITRAEAQRVRTEADVSTATAGNRIRGAAASERSAVAGAAKDESGARVARGTERADIDAGNLKPELLRAQIASLLAPSPGAATADAAQEASANTLQRIVSAINENGADGLSPAAVSILEAPATTKLGSLGQSMLRAGLDAKQQSALRATIELKTQLQATLVKGAASDKDAAGISQSFTIYKSDKPAVKVEKLLILNALPLLTHKTDSQGFVASLDAFLKEAKKLGVPANSPRLKAFLPLRKGFSEADRQARLDRAAGKAGATVDALDADDALLQSRGLLRPAGPAPPGRLP